MGLPLDPNENLNADLVEQMRALERDVGGGFDSLRAGVLSLVVSESYENATREMRAYVGQRRDYPNYQARAERFVEHCADLIEAVRQKRQYPGLATLSMSKQQELHEKVLEHFQELKQNLKYIERLERDAKLADVRSTVWVVWAMVAAVGMILVAGFALDVKSGLLETTLTQTWMILSEFGDRLVALVPFF